MTSGTTQSIYIASRLQTAAGVYKSVNENTACTSYVDAGYYNVDLSNNERVTASTTGMVTIHVKSSQANLSAESGAVLAVMLEMTNGTLAHYLPIAAVGGTRCDAGATCYLGGVSVATGSSVDTVDHMYAVPYDAVNGTNVGFFPSDLCSGYKTQPTLNGADATGCTPFVGAATAGVTPESNPAAAGSPLSITFKIVSLPGGGALAPSSVLDSGVLSAYFQYDPPKISSCNVTENTGLYFPGDGQIFVQSDYFSMGACAGTPASGRAPVDDLVMVANASPSDPNIGSSFATTNTLVKYASYGGFVSFSGFTNATSASDGKYRVGFLMRDAAGMIATPPTVPGVWAFDNTDCGINGVQTSAVNGFLASSRCFIASAAYASGDAEPVHLLRRFRDDVLSRFAWGRTFTRFYYKWSPPAAQWLLDRPILRLPLLKLLTPLEVFAWLAVRPGVLAVLGFFGLLLVLSTLGRRISTVISLSLVTLASLGHDASASYIEQLQQEQREEGNTVKSDTPTEGAPYIDSIKKRIVDESNPLNADSHEGYSERLRLELEAKPSSEGYSDQERSKIETPTEGAAARPSAIGAVNAGESDLRPKYGTAIHWAGGIKYNVFPLRSATGGNGNFDAIYGTQYVPEVGFFGEWQPFHSEWFGSIGLTGSVGLALFRGVGQYGVSNLDIPQETLTGATFGSTSRTKFFFHAIPVTLGVNYRFNLLRVLRPYVGASGVLHGFIETRDDGGNTKVAYSLGAQVLGGVAILLDFFEPGSAWGAFQSSGIRHSYIVAEYGLMIPFSGDITYTSSGLQAGLAFEF